MTELCQNAAKRGTSSHARIVTPQCRSNPQEYAVRISYSHAESDALWLCEECKDQVVRESRSYDYDVEVWEIPE